MVESLLVDQWVRFFPECVAQGSFGFSLNSGGLGEVCSQPSATVATVRNRPLADYGPSQRRVFQKLASVLPCGNRNLCTCGQRNRLVLQFDGAQFLWALHFGAALWSARTAVIFVASALQSEGSELKECRDALVPIG